MLCAAPYHPVSRLGTYVKVRQRAQSIVGVLSTPPGHCRNCSTRSSLVPALTLYCALRRRVRRGSVSTVLERDEIQPRAVYRGSRRALLNYYGCLVSFLPLRGNSTYSPARADL